MKKKRVLDSYALLVFLEKEGAYKRIQDLLSAEDDPVFMNAINVGEVFYILSRQRGDRAAEYFLSVVLPGLPIAVLDNSFDNVMEAARLKAKHALSFADCFAAATAIRENAVLVTGDPEFRKLGRAVTVEWID
ncbi:MAG: type II toxin-antitoxin system VapC family toxin [Candidatus Aminicenantes bacterium]|nr:type II toxin-antitoxin system VapC family toxin [Candidatus Aminicenantes bacterium]